MSQSLSDKVRTNRRTVLGLLGTGSVLALAGCADDGDDDTDEADDDTTDPDENGNDTTGNGDDTTGNGDDTTDDDGGDGTEQLDQPVEFPEGEPCAVCNMIASEYPEWNAQLVHETGERVFFCSSGCFSAYYAEPLTFGDVDDPIENAWVTEYDTEELLDASEAYFVRVTNAEHVDDIMRINPTPFASSEDAEAFVDEFEEYDESDIIRLDAFDRDLALLYRERFLEGGENETDSENETDGANETD